MDNALLVEDSGHVGHVSQPGAWMSSKDSSEIFSSLKNELNIIGREPKPKWSSRTSSSSVNSIYILPVKKTIFW